MKLDRLSLTNYRRFESLVVAFHPELTVLVARNGEGKTSVLEAITSAFGTFVGAFDLGKAKHIDQADARRTVVDGSPESEAHYPVVIEALGSWEGVQQTWRRALTGTKNKTTIKDAAPVTQYGKKLQDYIREERNIGLPLIAYYGTSRLWLTHKNLSRKSVVSASRSLGYEDCLSPASNYKQLQQWFSKANFALWQGKRSDGPYADSLEKRIAAVRNAVDIVLEDEGWYGLDYDPGVEEMIIRHREQGVLPLGMLSDGVRAMVTLVADIAFRCTKLNPQMEERAAAETMGILLIDEVDMHLHPLWQQRVIVSLRRAFPKLQLIITTHSPQVLSTVPRESLRLLKGYWKSDTQGWMGEVEIPSYQAKGTASSDALIHLMGTNPQPDVEEAQWIADYTAAIEEGTHEEAEGRTLRKKLLAFYGATHPVMRDADRLIRFQSFKLRRQMSNKD